VGPEGNVFMTFVPFVQNVARHQLYLEFLRSAIVGLLEAPEKSMEEILWTGFLFLKVSKCDYTSADTRGVQDNW